MAIVRYHGLGASNLGKVRPAPYKYADPTDINNATTFPVYAKPGTTFGDLFYGDGAPEFGMSGKQLRTWHNQKERRDAANTAAGFYTRCQEGNGGSAGMPFDPSLVDKLPLITSPTFGVSTGDIKDETSVLGTYTFSSARYADKQQIWCKKPRWMFETLTFKRGERPEGWFDFRFNSTYEPLPISEQRSRLAAALKERVRVKDVSNPENKFNLINGSRAELGSKKTNALLNRLGVMPNYDFEYAEFAKFILPTVNKKYEKYETMPLGAIFVPKFNEYQQQLRNYIGKARTETGPSKVACFLDYDIAGAIFPPLDSKYLDLKDYDSDGSGNVKKTIATPGFDDEYTGGDIDDETPTSSKAQQDEKLYREDLGPNLWPPRDDTNADPGDKWPARGIDELRYQFSVTEEETSVTDEAYVTEMAWKPLDARFDAFKEYVEQQIGIGLKEDLKAAYFNKGKIDEEVDEEKGLDSNELPEVSPLGEKKGRSKLVVPALGYQQNALTFPSTGPGSDILLSHEQSIGVNKGTSFDGDLEFDGGGPVVFGAPTLKPWKHSIETASWFYGFDHDVEDGQTWNDVSFMSGVPWVDITDINPELGITVEDLNQLVRPASIATDNAVDKTMNNFIEGSKVNETPSQGNRRQAFARKVFAGDDTMYAYINYGQKDSMDAGDPPGGHDGRGDPTTFNGYGLLNGFGGDDNIYALMSSTLAYGGSGDDVMTGLDNFYDRLYGERGNDVLVSMGQDVMDGGSGNDIYHLVIEPRLIRNSLELDYTDGGAGPGSVKDPAGEMANAVSIEGFDLKGYTQDHSDLEGISTRESRDFKDILMIDKENLMLRYAMKYHDKSDLTKLDMAKAKAHFNTAPRLGFSMDPAGNNLKTKSKNPDGSDILIGGRSSYPASFYLWLGKEDFKGRQGADPLIERYLSLDLTWNFLGRADGDYDAARTFRESETLAKFSDVRPEELGDLNDIWDDNWDDVYSQFGKTNIMHKHLIAQSVAEMNPDYAPFKPFLQKLEQRKETWVGDGCDVVNKDQPYEVIRKYNPGRTAVLPTAELEKLTPIVDEFAWNLWDQRREDIMDQIKLVNNPVPAVTDLLN